MMMSNQTSNIMVMMMVMIMIMIITAITYNHEYHDAIYAILSHTTRGVVSTR